MFLAKINSGPKSDNYQIRIYLYKHYGIRVYSILSAEPCHHLFALPPLALIHIHIARPRLCLAMYWMYGRLVCIRTLIQRESAG